MLRIRTTRRYPQKQGAWYSEPPLDMHPTIFHVKAMQWCPAISSEIRRKIAVVDGCAINPPLPVALATFFHSTRVPYFVLRYLGANIVTPDLGGTYDRFQKGIVGLASMAWSEVVLWYEIWATWDKNTYVLNMIQGRLIHRRFFMNITTHNTDSWYKRAIHRNMYIHQQYQPPTNHSTTHLLSQSTSKRYIWL